MKSQFATRKQKVIRNGVHTELNKYLALNLLEKEIKKQKLFTWNSIQQINNCKETTDTQIIKLLIKLIKIYKL